MKVKREKILNKYARIKKVVHSESVVFLFCFSK